MKKALIEIVSGGKSFCMGKLKSGRRVLIKENPPQLKPFPKYVIVELGSDITVKAVAGKPMEWFVNIEEAIKRAKEVGADIEVKM